MTVNFLLNWDIYLGLMVIALLAATLLPLGSEAFLLTLAAQGYDIWALWFWATLGNSLGSIINYGLGRYLLHYQDKRWFPIRPPTLNKAQMHFQRYGQWSILFAWLPIIGDALTLVAGILKMHFGLFVVLVILGKGLRYAVLVGILSVV
ncbi:YqaA family protein [Thiosulfativibrio zosterae]|uniref:Membrane protein n=1 Tax=Thiosulfativibrio zosterae TaxID=2675053 RepID=A0A6F8PJR6_9GAMM|nr:YqaA family protein [Thiosulfativibrio zosterae]BBP42342.1 membrane protein [Thiosulfativibrio zosterae]